MKLLRSIKIGPRLYTMFGLLMISLVIVAYSSVVSRLGIINDNEYLKRNYIDHLAMLAEVNITTGNLFLSYRNYYLEYPDQEKMQVRLDDINARTNFILTKLQEYQSFLQQGTGYEEELTNVAAAIKKLQDEVLPFNDKLVGLVQSEQMEEVHGLIISKELRSLRSTLQDDLITKIYDDCLNNSILLLDSNIADMRASNFRVNLVVAVLIVLVALIAVATVRSLVEPIKRLVLVSREISEGNVDVNLPAPAKDEIGELTGQFGSVAGVLKGLIGGMERMSELHSQGDMDARIDQSGFRGAYMDVAAGVNSMVESYVQQMKDLCGVLDEFGTGNFNVTYGPLPGKKAVLSDAVEKLRRELTDVGCEIRTLSEAAVNGQLSTRSDPSHFEGDWKALIISLNDVMDAVINPINEASKVLRAMSEGNLKAKIEGEYNGDFAIIKTSLNSTQEAISSYIDEISRVLGEMSKRDLSVSISRKYIGDFSIIRDSINMIVSTFNKVLAEFSGSAEQSMVGSKQISGSSYNLAQAAAEQASEIEKLNEAVTNISQKTEKNAEVAERANGLSISVKDNAVKETEMMKKTMEAMEAINESSRNISKIIKVIEDIAFQTNLLALNAAVEAARAGEHGKGFAVVAEEVRSLASRSQVAAHDTTELIEGSVHKASEGAKIVAETGAGLTEIVAQITEISDYIDQIALASANQNQDINRIRQGISNMTQVTSTNTAISEECASSAQELASQSEMFKATVEQFKLG